MTTDRLDEAVKALGSDLKGQRDRALLLPFACAMRRADAVALRRCGICGTMRAAWS